MYIHIIIIYYHSWLGILLDEKQGTPLTYQHWLNSDRVIIYEQPEAPIQIPATKKLKVIQCHQAKLHILSLPSPILFFPPPSQPESKTLLRCTIAKKIKIKVKNQQKHQKNQKKIKPYRKPVTSYGHASDAAKRTPTRV